MDFPFIKGFLETSFIDWEGHLTSVIFTGGCNFACPYCQNAALVKNFEKIPGISFEKISDFLKPKKDWIDGICVTGGEPTLNPGLAELLKTLKDWGFKIKLDSNASKPKALENLMKDSLVDYLALDFKAPLDERYSRASGVKVDLEKIKKSLALAKNSGLPYELRTTCVPGLMAEPELKKMLPELKDCPKFVIQNFKPKEALDENYRKIKPFSPAQLEKLAEIVRPVVKKVVVRN